MIMLSRAYVTECAESSELHGACVERSNNADLSYFARQVAIRTLFAVLLLNSRPPPLHVEETVDGTVA